MHSTSLTAPTPCDEKQTRSSGEAQARRPPLNDLHPMDGYTPFFGTEEQPDLPVRSVFEVAGLADPTWLVEIEVVALRPPQN